MFDKKIKLPTRDEAPKGRAERMPVPARHDVLDARLEPSLQTATAGARYQFERLGYFCVDPDSKPGALVLNRTVALKDTWAKKQSK